MSWKFVVRTYKRKKLIGITHPIGDVWYGGPIGGGMDASRGGVTLGMWGKRWRMVNKKYEAYHKERGYPALRYTYVVPVSSIILDWVEDNISIFGFRIIVDFKRFPTPIFGGMKTFCITVAYGNSRQCGTHRKLKRRASEIMVDAGRDAFRSYLEAKYD